MKTKLLPILFSFYFTQTLCALLSCSNPYNISNYEIKETSPQIEPDYTNLVIPPNIAPMNFTILEKGEKFLVKIYVDSNDVLRLPSRTPRIKIPPAPWLKILNHNKGKTIYFEIFAYDGKWTKYKRFGNKIAPEPIDRYLVYRFLRPNYTVQKEMQIRQRDLQSDKESLVMTTKTIAGCINCHTFHQNDPDKMLFHIRWGAAAGTIIAKKKHIAKIDTRTDFNQSPGAYPSWHPNGIAVAFSVNKVQQFFHAAGNSRDVIDLTSDIIMYQTESHTVVVEPQLTSRSYMETFPDWSPDGRSLYFCRAPQLEADFDLDQDYRTIKYDLMRLPYNPDTEEWGRLETLVFASETGLSCSQPRVSPDGKFLLFCMAEYGNFPIFHSSADLYIMSLENNQIHRLGANSDAPEGFHSWSSNSRWIVFTSKRDNTIFTRLYFSYVDQQGVAHKAFILPLQEPENYRTNFNAYSVPELIKNPIPYRPQQFIDVALDVEHAQRAQLAPGTVLSPQPEIADSPSATDFP
ncbi:hypothetical protein EH223_01015 [candidate division KSB1 bacterium]|nr:PD40 domain-containing protein [candidate division KSB1 bacterium]RQW06977.1 MAG: hypothetical protein EH223_01015 [candidate division KSB1 bacterium]